MVIVFLLCFFIFVSVFYYFWLYIATKATSSEIYVVPCWLIEIKPSLGFKPGPLC